MSADTLSLLDIKVGDRIAPSDIEGVLSEHEPALARRRALRLLAHHERTASEVRSRLEDDGYPEAVADDVVVWLVDTGLVDDTRFAESFARVLIEVRGLGRSRAMIEMTRRGVDDGLAASSIDTVAPSLAEPERALRVATRASRSGDTVPRLAARLVRRGFSTGEALRAARTVLADDEHDDTGDAL